MSIQRELKFKKMTAITREEQDKISNCKDHLKSYHLGEVITTETSPQDKVVEEYYTEIGEDGKEVKKPIYKKVWEVITYHPVICDLCQTSGMISKQSERKEKVLKYSYS